MNRLQYTLLLGCSVLLGVRGAESSTYIVVGSTVTGSLTTESVVSSRRPGAYSALYTFNGTAGQSVAITLSSTQFDTYLYLVRPGGTILDENDDNGIVSDSRIPVGSGMLSLPETGSYTIEATSFSTNTFGTFTLTLSGPCAAVPTAAVGVDSLDLMSDPDGAGVRLVAGRASTARIQQIANAGSQLPLPAFPGQKFCGAVRIAPGLSAEVLVPTAAERSGDYSGSGLVLYDPLTRQVHADGTVSFLPFPGNVVPINRLQSCGSYTCPFAWKLGSIVSFDRPQKLGAYSSGYWLLDVNGSYGWEGLPSDDSFALGLQGLPMLGDWDGTGGKKAANYSNGTWRLDYNGNRQWDGSSIDKEVSFGWTGAIPLVGDWNGDGKDEIGVYSEGFWFLDYNGDYQWDGGINDKLIGWGWPGATPVVGDWNGSGKTKIGVYSGGFWFLDYDGDYLWNPGNPDKQVGWGWAGVQTVVGDWNGDGRTKIGVYSAGFWFLDYDGDYVWNIGAGDKQVGWGWEGVTTVMGDWNGDGKTKIGVVNQGFWFLDFDGNYVWDGGTTDKIAGWGPGWTPVPGKW